MKYAFIDEDNIVVSLLHFEEEPSDITPFLENQKIILNNSNITAIIPENEEWCNIGFVLNGDDFIPQKPYPSWLWDDAKRIWMAPKVHPELIYGNHGAAWQWDEENQEWIPVRA